MKINDVSARIGHILLRGLYLVVSLALVFWMLSFILQTYPGAVPTIPFAIGLLISLYLHKFVHFMGHWLFGYFGGLTLIGFSFLHKTYVKEKKRFVARPQPIETDLCPCLMVPQKVAEDPSYTSYWLGGIFLNFLTSLLTLILAIFLLQGEKDSTLIRYVICFCLSYFSIGFVKTWMDGMPSWRGKLPNDGLAAIKLRLNSLSNEAFLANMKILSILSRGRYPGRDLGRRVLVDWGVDLEDAEDPFVALLILRQCELLIWHKQYRPAERYLSLLYESVDCYPEEWQNQIEQECIFVLTLQPQNKPLVNELLTEERIRFYKDLASAESLRCLYAWSLRMSDDTKDSSVYEGAAFRAANGIAFRPAAASWKQALADLSAEN